MTAFEGVRERSVRVVVKAYGPDGQCLTDWDRTMTLAAADEMLGHVWDAWDETYGVDDD